MDVNQPDPTTETYFDASLVWGLILDQKQLEKATTIFLPTNPTDQNTKLVHRWNMIEFFMPVSIFF